MKTEFKFNLDQSVVIKVSNEEGMVIGRAEYLYSAPSYLIRYQAADGRGVDAWWDESALAAAV